jgi:hypothetical protein
VPLFLRGPDYVEQTNNIPLYIHSEPYLLSSTTDLFLKNDGVLNTCNLYIDGRYNTNNNVPLFLKVDDNIEEGNVDLYIEGNVSSSSTIPLFIVSEITNSVDLSIPYVKDTGTYTQTFDLYISGRR